MPLAKQELESKLWQAADILRGKLTRQTTRARYSPSFF